MKASRTALGWLRPNIAGKAIVKIEAGLGLAKPGRRPWPSE
jgi:hypothetical protein